MANMPHCRFENTYRNLLDCYNHILDNNLSETEKSYRKKLIEICDDISVYIIDDDYVNDNYDD